MASRCWVTIRELNAIRSYAEEGLSIRRTAAVLGRSPGTIATAARIHGIKFLAQPGYLPYVSQEEMKTRHRLEQRRYMARKRMEMEDAEMDSSG